MKSMYSLIDLLLIVTSLALLFIGCGPKHYTIYPIKGCDYWPSKYHYGQSFYVAGPPRLEMQPFIKQCFPDKRKVSNR